MVPCALIWLILFLKPFVYKEQNNFKYVFLWYLVYTCVHIRIPPSWKHFYTNSSLYFLQLLTHTMLLCSGNFPDVQDLIFQTNFSQPNFSQTYFVPNHLLYKPTFSQTNFSPKYSEISVLVITAALDPLHHPRVPRQNQNDLQFSIEIR